MRRPKRTDRPKARGSKTVHTHAVLWKISKHALSHVESGRDGAIWDAVVVVLSAAFMVEAHLNLVGAKLFRDWTTSGRTSKERLSPDQKLRLICSELGIPIDGRSKRHRAFVDAFRVRKALVHGRTVTLHGEWNPQQRGRDVFAALPSEWERICRPTQVRAIHEELCALVTELNSAAGLGEFPFLRILSGTATVP